MATNSFKTITGQIPPDYGIPLAPWQVFAAPSNYVTPYSAVFLTVFNAVQDPEGIRPIELQRVSQRMSVADARMLVEALQKAIKFAEEKND